MTSSTGLKKASETALARVDSFTVADADFVGQKCPNMSAGHKSIIYFLLAAANIGAQGAWATMGLLFLPIGSAIAMGFMGLIMIGRAFSEDEGYEQNDGDEQPPINVTAQEVGEETRLNALSVAAQEIKETLADEPTFEPNPFASSKFGSGQPLYPGEVYASPEDREAATGQPVVPEIDYPWRIASTTQPDSLPKPMDIARFIAVNLKLTLITAMPRKGKGVVVAQAWREFKQAHPNGIVWVIQPKPHPDEAGYWQGVDGYWGEMLEDYLGDSVQLKRVAQELSDFIKNWRAQPQRPKLLIIDELIKLQAILPSWYGSFMVPTIKVEASSGETDGRLLWLATQSPLTTDLKMSAGNRSPLQLLTLQTPDSGEHLTSLRSSFNTVPDIPDGLFEASESPKKAVFYHSAIGEWYPAPEYPVYEPKKIPAITGVSAEPMRVQPFSPFSFGWDFGDTSSTAEIDAQIAEFQRATDNRYHCVAEFLQWLKEQGNGAIIQLGDISRSNWAARWQGKPGGLMDRKGASIQPFISNCLKIGFLKEQEVDKYEIVIF